MSNQDFCPHLYGSYYSSDIDTYNCRNCEMEVAPPRGFVDELKECDCAGNDVIRDPDGVTCASCGALETITYEEYIDDRETDYQFA